MTRTAIGLLLAKIESTYGTDPTPNSTSNAIAVAGAATFSADVDHISRSMLDGSWERVGGPSARPRAQIQFSVEIRGNRTNGSTNDISNGTSAEAIEIDPLLKACDLAPTYTAASPLNSGRNGGVAYYGTTPTGVGSSVTLWWYSENKLHKINGAKGNFRLSAEAGKLGVIDFTFQGLLGSIADDSLPGSVTFQSTTPPLIQAMAASIGGVTGLVIPRFEFNLNNSLGIRDDVNRSGGIKGLIVTDRAPSFTFDAEDETEATHPAWTDLIAGTAKALTIGPGGSMVTGNKFSMAINGAQRSLRYGDRSGGRIVTVEYAVEKAALNTAPETGGDFGFSWA